MNIIIPDSKKEYENKLTAEKIIIENLEFSDTNEYCDTVSVTISFVQDVDTFFRIFNEATHELAFTAPWKIVNHIDLTLGKNHLLSFQLLQIYKILRMYLCDVGVRHINLKFDFRATVLD